jgi:hypothetical protein
MKIRTKAEGGPLVAPEWGRRGRGVVRVMTFKNRAGDESELEK